MESVIFRGAGVGAGVIFATDLELESNLFYNAVTFGIGEKTRNVGVFMAKKTFVRLITIRTVEPPLEAESEPKSEPE